MPFEADGDVSNRTKRASLRVGRFVVRGVATSIGVGVYVDAHAEGLVELTCSRCLGSFTKKLELDCEAEFVENPKERLDEEDRHEVEVFPLKSGVCDLSEMVRHEVLLSLPMKPLCSQGCKGLCPVCGANLNQGDCDCEGLDSKRRCSAGALSALNEREGEREMAVPKKRTSASRRDKRKANNWKLEAPNLVECPHCHVLILPHRVCPDCGWYRGKQVVKIEER